jgi:putative addiction module killer protein
MPLSVEQSTEFQAWHEGLKDERAQRRISSRILRVREGLLGDARSLGGGLSELKIDYGPGYRLYFAIQGGRLLLLLCGGDKSSQQRDIERARAILKTKETGRG